MLILEVECDVKLGCRDCVDLDDGCGMLQMQDCSINRHLLEEVKERERGAEAQLARRRKLLDDANMDADLKRLARESSELAAKASALRKVSIQAAILHVTALLRPHGWTMAL